MVLHDQKAGYQASLLSGDYFEDAGKINILKGGIALADKITMVSRLTEQKGFVYLIPSLWEFLQDIQIVLQGAGDRAIANELYRLSRVFPDFSWEESAQSYLDIYGEAG